jgi:enamine deaminase RidA (YjgF/YER057c/UK114 family)
LRKRIISTTGAPAAIGPYSQAVRARDTNLEDFAKVNEVYGSYFPTDPPARATVQAAALPRGASVEIDLVAYVGE